MEYGKLEKEHKLYRFFDICIISGKQMGLNTYLNVCLLTDITRYFRKLFKHEVDSIKCYLGNIA